MGSSSTTLFDRNSSFVEWTTQASRGVLINLVRLTATQRQVSAPDAFEILFDGNYLPEKLRAFQQLLIVYLISCYDDYAQVQEQITQGTMRASDVDENNAQHYFYCVVRKIKSQRRGYKHLNCIFDATLMLSTFQFKHVFESISRDRYPMSSTSNRRDSYFNEAELNVFRYILTTCLNAATENFANLYQNGQTSLNFRVQCSANGSCALPWKNEKERVNEKLRLASTGFP